MNKHTITQLDITQYYTARRHSVLLQTMNKHTITQLDITQYYYRQ